MKYKTLGDTGFKVSVLGFGCMRLPSGTLDIRSVGAKLVQRGIDMGINYLDTAYYYGDNEYLVGEALKDGYRDKVVLETKNPFWRPEYNRPEHFEWHLDAELERLGVDCIDIYMLHGLNRNLWRNKVPRMDVFNRVEKAKAEGKIRHLGFSFHDKPDALKEIIDSARFDVMLVQYNILDQGNAEMISYAAEKGMGVSIMGSVGGGRLALEPSGELRDLLTEGRNNFADLALRFVWTHPGVTCAFSGMTSQSMLYDNVALASGERQVLDDEESTRVKRVAEIYGSLMDVPCTGCGYCMPCPQEVNIPFIFNLYNNWKLFNFIHSKIDYSLMGLYHEGKDASACVECGQCMQKCPQGIQIVESLRRAHEVLTA